VDDVIPAADGQRTAYVSPDSYQVLDLFRGGTGEALHLFSSLCASSIRRAAQGKYIAMLRRKASG